MVELQWTDVFFVWLLAIGQMALCHTLNPKLAWDWFWSSCRAVTQLTALGFVLAFIFANDQWLARVAVILFMVLASSITIVNRTGKTVRLIDAVLTLLLVVLVGAVPFLVWVRKVEVTQATFLIPFIGTLLGNSLSGLTLGLNQFNREVNHRRPEIEFMIAMGATSAEAIRPFKAESLATAMVVILNAMAIAGVVTIPGQMTGQLMAGGDLVSAVALQIVILISISSVICLATWVLLCVRAGALFDTWGAFRESIQPELGAWAKS